MVELIWYIPQIDSMLICVVEIDTLPFMRIVDNENFVYLGEL